MPRKIVKPTVNHGKIARISIAQTADCAAEKFCFSLNAGNDTKSKWIADHDLFIANDGRIYTLVDTTKRVYFMDAITGTLFQFGECMTSAKLNPRKFVRDNDKASTILKSMQAKSKDAETD